LNDNYQFLYPFGWQEVTVTGTDVVYKDVIEPLESVSVTITATDKKDVTEFGDIADVSGGAESSVWAAALWERRCQCSSIRDDTAAGSPGVGVLC
jgi:photosystem II oxygen-evolving enhancer protein 2